MSIYFRMLLKGNDNGCFCNILKCLSIYLFNYLNDFKFVIQFVWKIYKLENRYIMDFLIYKRIYIYIY